MQVADRRLLGGRKREAHDEQAKKYLPTLREKSRISKNLQKLRPQVL
jgi:hypothetical protein